MTVQKATNIKWHHGKITKDDRTKLLRQKGVTIWLTGLSGSGKSTTENIRRIGEVAKLFTDANIITITAFISPYRQDRDNVRKLLKDGEFIEVYIKCPIDVCEQRDTKGLYKKARAGEVKEFTGISAPYEEPLNPELTIDTSTMTVDESTRIVIQHLEQKGYVKF